MYDCITIQFKIVVKMEVYRLDTNRVLTYLGIFFGIYSILMFLYGASRSFPAALSNAVMNDKKWEKVNNRLINIGMTWIAFGLVHGGIALLLFEGAVRNRHIIVMLYFYNLFSPLIPVHITWKKANETEKMKKELIEEYQKPVVNE